jgi:hypothetical protein
MKREVRYLLLGVLLLVSQVLIYYAMDWVTMPLGVVLGTAIVFGALCRHYILAACYGFLSPWTFVLALTLKTTIFPIVRGEDWQQFLIYCVAGSGAGLLMAWWWKRIVRQCEEDWKKAREAAAEGQSGQDTTHDV